MSSHELFRSLKVLSFGDQCRFSSLLLLLQIFNQIKRSNTKFSLSGSSHNYNTRKLNVFQSEKSVSARYGSSGIYNSMIREFDALPARLRLIKNFRLFKRRVREYIETM